MTRSPWTYPPELLAALGGFGLAPVPETAPTLVREALSHLYRYEIRRLRDRLLAKAFPKADYIGHVIALRKKYWPLSLTPGAWEQICRGAGEPGAEMPDVPGIWRAGLRNEIEEEPLLLDAGVAEGARHDAYVAPTALGSALLRPTKLRSALRTVGTAQPGEHRFRVRPNARRRAQLRYRLHERRPNGPQARPTHDGPTRRDVRIDERVGRRVDRRQTDVVMIEVRHPFRSRA